MDEELKRYEACMELVGNKESLRVVGEKFGIPSSTLDHWIHTKLRSMSEDLYQKVVEQLKINYERRGELGGRARKRCIK